MLLIRQWTDDRVELLKRHWEAGDSARTIALAMGINRNMVLGKVHRLKLEPRGIRNGYTYDPQLAKAVRREQAAKKKPRVRIVRSNGNSNGMRLINTVDVEQMRLRCVEIIPLNLTLAEIREDQCRYIAGDDHLYCGHPKKEGSSYCTPHHFLVWEKPKPRTDKTMNRRAA